MKSYSSAKLLAMFCGTAYVSSFCFLVSFSCVTHFRVRFIRGQLMNELNAQECDATNDAQRVNAGNTTSVT
jgi:hypothetical protein